MMIATSISGPVGAGALAAGLELGMIEDVIEASFAPAWADCPHRLRLSAALNVLATAIPGSILRRKPGRLAVRLVSSLR